ncbi:carboxylesterase/lipase family protein [Candidatus Binatus sp.]|uniref:carboxylesterase/lipase family protein n=1 Tax=Candidatus Binatus sp. TaxID=2811406 RepID=UPI002FD92925
MSATVSIHQGKLEGDEQGGLLVFKGVPFAAPPVGARRWLAPEKLESWTGLRDARRFGAVSHQNQVMLSALSAMVVGGEQSEDCLSLNVWTPTLDGKRRPVMVWIHGGAFTIGSGSQPLYDGSVLARRGDVVVVTINYRLGPLGFLRLADVTNGKIPATGNEGMLDQVAALRWVRDNIAEFGGDPGNVTIFGESAGGMSVGTILAMPSARGLFHKAIPQSGASHTGASVARANRTAERVLSKLGVHPGDAGAIRALTPEQLLTGTLLDDGRTPDPELGMAYQPVVDGTHVPRAAIEMVGDGTASGVAVMVGSTLEEWKLFSLMDPSLHKLDRAGLGARVSRRLTAAAADALIDTYEKARAARGESVTPAELFTAIETDRTFRMPGVRLAQVQRRHDSRVYSYLFTWPSPAMGGVLGSCHALELGFVFGTNSLPGMTMFAGAGPAAEKLAAQMQDAWLAFARSGDPSCESAGTWEGYTEARRPTMVFGANTKLEDAPRDQERRAWDAIPDRIFGSL